MTPDSLSRVKGLRRSLREVRARLGLRKTSKHLARRDIKKTGGDSRTSGWDTYDPWGWKCLGRFEGSLYEEVAKHTGNTPLRANSNDAMDLSLGFKIYEDWSVLDRAVLSLDASLPRLPACFGFGATKQQFACKALAQFLLAGS